MADYVGAVVMPGGASQPRKQLDAWQEWAKQRGARGLAYVLVGEAGELGGPVAKNLTDAERAGLAGHVGAEPGDCIFFAAGAAKPSRALLGAARLEIGRRCGLIDERAWSFLWVVDAPLFEPAAEATASGTSRSATARGPPSTTRSPRRSRSSRTPSTWTRGRRSPTPTTSSATATRSAVAPSVSTAATSRSASSRSWGSATKAQEKFRFPPRRLPVRRAAARRHRLRLGPHRLAPGSDGVDPRRHRLPEVGRRLRPLTGAPAPITPVQRKERGSTRPPSRRRQARRPHQQGVCR